MKVPPFGPNENAGRTLSIPMTNLSRSDSDKDSVGGRLWDLEEMSWSS